MKRKWIYPVFFCVVSFLFITSMVAAQEASISQLLYDEPVGDPGDGYIEAYIDSPTIAAFDWTEGGDLHLCVSGVGYPASIDPGAWTTECDLYQGNQTVPPAGGGTTLVEYDTSPHVIAAGDYVTVSDGVTAKYHQVRDLALLVVDPNNDVIFGTAETGLMVRVNVWDCALGLDVLTDGSGDWLADFNTICDIQLGFEGQVRASNADGATVIGWQVPNPWIEAYLGESAIDAVDWPEGQLLDICVGSTGFPASIDPTLWTTECDLYHSVEIVPPPNGHTRVSYDTSPHLLAYGDYVTISDGIIAKYHQMTELTLLVVDPDLDLVAGTAAVSREVQVEVHDCGVGLPAVADGSGDWSADFSGICNIQYGFEGTVWDPEDGGYSIINWHLPNTRIEAFLNIPYIDAEDWPEGADVHVCVGSGGFPGPDPATWTTECDLYQDMQTVQPGAGEVSFEISPLSLSDGDYVTASDGVTAKFHQITGLTLTAVDPDTNIISGTAAAGAEISVWVRECDVVENVIADGFGDWAIDFTPTCSIEPGFLGKIWDLDPDNDASTILWYVSNPWIEAYIDEPNIDAADWPDGADVHVCVGSGGFPASINPADWITECDLYQGNQIAPNPLFDRAYFDTSPHVLVQGDYVTVSDGTLAKFHQVTELALVSVDPATDVITGTAAPGEEIQVNVWDCDAEEYVITDSGGDWSADFSSTCNIELGFEGAVRDPDDDGDASNINWRLPNPWIEAFLGESYLDAVDWPEGADLHLCVGSGDFPASIDPGAWTTECDLYHENQTVGPPDEGDNTRVSYRTEPYIFAFGDYVTVSDGVIAKQHQMTELELLVVDPDLDILSGTAAPGKEIQIMAWDCDLENHFVTTDPGGDWVADLSGLCPLEPGSEGQVRDHDDDGDSSIISWDVPNPWIDAAPIGDNLSAISWPEGNLLHICVNEGDFATDPTDEINCSLFYTTGVAEEHPHDPEDTLLELHLDGVDLLPGHYVSVTDELIEKQLLVSPLQVLDVDPMTDTITGTTTPDSQLWVYIWDDCPGCEQQILSDGIGDWTADFSVDYDLVLGTEGSAEEFDDDGDVTFVHWRIPRPALEGFLDSSHANASDWPEGADLHICVGSGAFPASINPADWTTECDLYHDNQTVNPPDGGDQTWVDYDTSPHDLAYGDYVTVSDGVTAKYHLMSEVELLVLDPDLDIISGTALPGKEIEVNVWDCDTGQNVITDPGGNWVADFSLSCDLEPGHQGQVRDTDSDGDTSVIEWQVPNPLFDAYLSEPAVHVFDWPEAAEVYVCVSSTGYPASIDPGAWTTECDLFQDHQTVLPPDGSRTRLVIDTSPYDMVTGDYVTVSDGVTAKYHQLASLELVLADPDTDVVSGTAAPGEEIGVWISDCGAHQMVITDPGGDWVADFSSICDFNVGTEGYVWNTDGDGDSSVIHWHLHASQIHAQPQFDWITGNDWPDGDLVDVCVDSTGFTGDPTNPSNCDVYHGTALSEYNPDAHQTEAPFDMGEEDLQPGHYITMSDGVTLKELLVSDIHVTAISVDLDTISGTGTPNSDISVGIHDDCPGCWQGLVSDGSGDWTADFHGDYDLVPGSNGYVDEYDPDGDVTYIQWNIPNPYISAEPFIDRLSGFDWLAASEVYLCIDGSSFAPEGVSPDLWTSLECDLYLDSVITTPAPFNPMWNWFQIYLDGIVDLTAGLFITASDGIHRKTLELTDLRVLGTDHNNQLVLGTAEPGSDIHQTMFGAYPDFVVVAELDGTWSADYSGFPGWDYGTQGYSHQIDADGDHTWIKWENFPNEIYVNPDQELVYGNGFILESEVNLFVDEIWIDSMITFPSPTNELRGRLEFDLDGVFDILPGQNVCLRDVLGIRERCYQVEFLEVTMVDPIHDEISGNAEEGMEVRVGIDGIPGSEEIAVANALDQWQVDFEPPIDLLVDSTGYAQINYGLGEGTWVEWGHSPEIEVLGDGTSITDGDSTPDSSDDTDFGSAEVGIDTVVHSFVINNGGPGSLYLYDSPRVQISGAHAADFTVTTQPVPMVVPMGGTMFQITFDPSAVGLREAEVSIANNDSDENPFNFSIQGTGTAPEMDVLGNSVSITDGDANPSVADDTDFGSTEVASGTIVHTFTIENTGTADLNLTDSPEVQISGAQAGDFSVSSQPSSPVASGGGTTTFEITFDPSAVGLREAEVSIANNDSDENPYNFSIQGSGLILDLEPEMDVLGNSVSITDGDATPSVADDTDFGSVAADSGTVVHTFTIENTGDADLNLTDSPEVQISGAQAGDFTVSSQPSSPVASGGGTTTFEITFDPSAVGLREAEVSIANDDSDENPYTFAIQGTGSGDTFSDVNSTHWAYLYIEAIAKAGLTSGYPDGTYRPENRVTRAEMAVFLLNGMGVTAPALDGSHPFIDVAGHWAEQFIEELYDQGITGGYPDGTYRPQNLVTRAEMAVFLLKGIGVNPPGLDGSHPFSDVTGHWAEIFIEELFDQGITGGYPDGTYRPENRVTRAEMAVFLVNTFGLPLP